MELNIFQYRVRICSIKKKDIVKYMHVIVKHGLINTERRRFFSLTETGEDYSLVIEDDVYKEFQHCNGALEQEGVWVPLSVSSGAYSSAKMSGIAYTLIIPLADAGISIYNLSSYQTDYILVRESDLSKAVECLSSKLLAYEHSYGQTMPLDRVPLDIETNIPSDRVWPVMHNFHTLENKFHITSIDPDGLYTIGLQLIELLFYSKPEENDLEKFFSFTVVDKNVTLVLDENTLNRFPPNTIYEDEEVWRMLKITDENTGNGLGFSECGIVAQISHPIIAANISEYYISSFFSDHTLVPELSLDEVTEMLYERQQLAKQRAASTS